MLFVAGVSLIFHMAGSDAVHVERGTVRSHLARSRDTERVLVTNGFGSLQPACISRANAGRGGDHPACHDGRGSNRVRSAIRRSIEIWPSCVNESIRRRLACPMDANSPLPCARPAAFLLRRRSPKYRESLLRCCSGALLYRQNPQAQRFLLLRCSAGDRAVAGLVRAVQRQADN
jgi:hypothetical protein